MAHFPFLLLWVLSCMTLIPTAAEDVLISEQARLNKRFYDEAGNYNISFYHINDVHAHLDQFSSSGGACEDPTDGCFGGYSRVREVVTRGRKDHKDSLFLNVGDEFQGTPFFSYYQGAWKTSEALNMMGFDAMTLGNHEFDKGDQHLAEFLYNISSIPIISANIRTDHPYLNKTIKPFHYFEQHDLAVIGVTTNSTPGISSPGVNTIFLDPIKTVQETVDHIQSLGIKRIAALTHIGFPEDIRLAQETRGLHLIMGGHSHTLLGKMEGAEDDYPTIKKNLDGKEVFIVQAYRWGEYVGYIDVTYDAEGNILDYYGDPIHLTTTKKQDPELQALVKQWKEPFEADSKVVIGTSDVVLDQKTCQDQECLMGDVICDAMLDERISKAKENKDTELPVFAFTNSGGIRAPIDQGNITKGEVMTAFPFGNDIVELNMPGQVIWDLFEGILDRVNKNNSVTITSFAQVSRGIKIQWTPYNAQESPSIGKLVSIEIGGQPIDMAKVYKVVTIDFLANNGGDSFFSYRMQVPQLQKLDETLIEWVKTKTPMKPALEERLSHASLSSSSTSSAARSHRLQGVGWLSLFLLRRKR